MTEILKLIDYHLWATDLVTNQVLNLPEEKVTKEVGGSFPSIRLTLEHLLFADYLWMNRFTGTPNVDPPATWGTLAEMIVRWRDVQRQLREAAMVIAQRSEKEYKFITRSGTPHELPFLDIILQIVNHGNYHRGQIANMIRIQGEKPVGTDYFLFCVK